MFGQAPKRSVLFPAIVAALIAAGVAVPSTLASPGDQSAAYQSDVAHDGYIADAGLTAPLTQAWSVTLPGAVSYPLIVNGMVFVTAADQNVYALNQATGSIVWSHSLGGIYPWSGLTYERGRVFVVNSSGLLTAFNAVTGSIAWSKQMPGQYMFSSAPTASNGIVYTGGAGDGGTVYAVREGDGHLLWTQDVENGDQSSPAVDGQGVYVSYACQQAYDFAPLSGSLLWHHTSGCSGGGGKTPVLASGTIFARDIPLGNVMLSASTGAELGPFNAGPAPAVANDVAYMLSGSTLTAVNDAGQGTNAWTFTGDSSLDTAPLVVGGLVFEGSSLGNLYALDAATGTTSWSTNVGAGIPAPDEQNVSQPLTGLGAANGTLVVSAGSQLSAYRTAGTITTAPSNLSPPTIDGFAQVNQIQAADVGIWSGLPNSYTYQWELCDAGGGNCGDIVGATGATYTPATGDLGSTLRVKVVATNGVGSSAPVESAASAPISEAVPVNQTPPTVSGTAQQNDVLTATPGTWSGDPTSYSYHWRRCFPGDPSSCFDIGGATGSSYTIKGGDVGYALEVRVIATNSGGDSDPADSALTSTVQPAPVTTTISLTPPQQSIIAGGQAPLTAQVGGRATGTVDLYGTPNGGTKALDATGTLSGGVVSFNVGPTVTTTYSAVLEAGPGYSSSTSANVTVTVVPRSMQLATSAHTVTYGAKVKLTLTGAKSGTVDLLAATNGSASVLVSRATVAAGQSSATFTVPPERNTTYFAELEDHSAASNNATVSVRPLLVLAAQAKRVSARTVRRRGEKVLLGAGRKPALPGEPLKLEIWRKRQHGWRMVAEGNVPVGASGIFVAVLTIKATGQYRARVSFAADGNYVATHSNWRRFKVG